MDNSASESIASVIFFSAFGIAALVTSIVIAFRYVKNCSSPICSCTQDTSMSTHQATASTASTAMSSGVMAAIPNIIKTVTSGESTEQTIAGVMGDIASSVIDAPNASESNQQSTSGGNLTARVTTAVNSAMSVHTKAITSALAKQTTAQAQQQTQTQQQPKKNVKQSATPVAYIPTSTPRATTDVATNSGATTTQSSASTPAPAVSSLPVQVVDQMQLELAF